MRELSAVRKGWGEVERAEGRLARAISAQESFRDWLELQQVFEHQLRDTAMLFGPERLSALAELQGRLRRLADWQEQNGEPDSVHPKPPAAPPGS